MAASSIRTLLAPWAAAAAIACLVASCGEGGANPSSGVDLRQVMYEMEAFRLQIEPHTRNPEKFAEMADSGQGMLEWIQYPTFAEHTKSPLFKSNEQKFDDLHAQLQGSTMDFVAAARAQDLDALREAWIEMNMTCTACHKRFDPTH